MRAINFILLSICIILSARVPLSAQRQSAQDIDQIVNPDSVHAIESVLASDDMRGRGSFTPDIERAAD
jgi:hypothetical protein